MSLTACKECGNEISVKAKVCPHCGAPIKKHVSMKTVLIVFGILGALIMIGVYEDKPTSSEESEALTPEQRAAAANQQERESKERLGLIWQYSDTPDDMGRGNIKMAVVRSTNIINFGYPYNGFQRGELTLRKHPKYGKDVILSIDRGQFLCHSSDDCTVAVKFDNEKPQVYIAVGPEDLSTTSLFIRNFDRFLNKAKKASTVSIEAKFYQEGPRVFTFEISGLKW